MEKQFVDVNGQKMAYVEIGSGRPIVFLHGNPTSSYLWRNVMPELAHLGRCIAPDLIGMGDSAKLPDAEQDTYTFQTHRAYLDGFFKALDLREDVLFIIHDWGSALGFDWANRHRGSVSGIAYMEGIVTPLAGWDQFNPRAAPVFQAFRTEAGEDMILDKNMFIERVLPGSILRDLTPEEMDEYRRPFLNREDRWPTLTWPRQIPVGNDPVDVTEIVRAYSEWLAVSEMPKLFVNAEPGAILVGAVREICRGWPNQSEVTVAGSHFIQEDSGPEIGRAVAEWITINGI
ncbi:haloalkane dehalogenase [Shimia gijangensis]|uniref:Haloalkane dehalogenase n=1 Tax=Shimia gijangensis TaxID=1470563 RepID=A0A1M6J040_9RHOB|nr:haloalkane dehalogenase [Shimia gijangensis]SHJ40105.1 haloalkane dehalogenase [Shimia gijangensis]